MLATHIDELVGRPITPFPNMPGKTEIDDSTSWASATSMTDVDGVPGSCLQPGQDLAAVAIWGVKRWMAALQPHLHFLSLCISNKQKLQNQVLEIL